MFACEAKAPVVRSRKLSELLQILIFIPVTQPLLATTLPLGNSCCSAAAAAQGAPAHTVAAVLAAALRVRL